MSADFLLEIGCEELPAKTLRRYSEQLATLLQQQLAKVNVTHGSIKFFATPRRLAVLIEAVAEQQPSQLIEKKGPALSAAFDAAGNPTPACIGFARSCGVAVSDLQQRDTEKGPTLFFSIQQPGAPTLKLLPELIQQALANLAIPKPMRWGNHEIEFIRPVHWVCARFGTHSLDTRILGHTTIGHTYGHRFLYPHQLALESPTAYEKILQEKGMVITDFARRQTIISEQLHSLATRTNAEVVVDPALLEEVTGLVEWPVALLGQLEAHFLAMPPEVLITAMKVHQKCFPLRAPATSKLLPYFITVANISSQNPSRVISGNERVMRARLTDANFFYQEDLACSLESRLPALKNLTFQNKLGSMYDKAQRIAALAQWMASQITVNPEEANRAAQLAKTDLVSHMVGEFPELQGTMGYYYALNDKESPAIATAIKEHYFPRFSGDQLPDSPLGCLIALADRIDTLVGIFGIQQAPTGEKDPFSLRRAALGVLRILIERQLPLDLHQLFVYAQQQYQVPLPNAELLPQVFTFTMERLKAWYGEQDISPDVFAAVIARTPTQPLDFHSRARAVAYFAALPEAQALIAANKRVSNLLKKEQLTEKVNGFRNDLLELAAEKALAAAVEEKTKQVPQLCATGHYHEALLQLASLQQPVNAFFDEVLVMAEDPELRKNRIALLAQLRQLFLEIADISLLQRG